MSTRTTHTDPSAPLRLAACASLSLLITLFVASVINHSVVSGYAAQQAVTAPAEAATLPALPAVTVVAAR
ncbi:MAG TPA: hypothetical protein VMD56_10795 [Steroidobacteraceae bacterium]|nr:hypothetical protein [Steroidobacteraceae bacterium]